MCNAYRHKAMVRETADLFGARALADYNQPEDVYPKYPGLVVREDAGTRVLQQMIWGFPRHSVNRRTGAPNKPTAVNNLRDDKLWTFWRKQFVDPGARCLIPFTAFAEAEGPDGAKTRTWISVADQPVAMWAGLWRPSVEWGDVYSGVMVDATAELWDIHDRMPVILHPGEHDAWLRAPAEEAMALVRKYPADRLTVERTDERWSFGARKPAAPAGPKLI